MKQHELFKSIYASNLKSRAVNVMSCLITHMNTQDNTCFPSIKTLAKCCSISVNTVKRALDDLVSAGFVEKKRVLSKLKTALKQVISIACRLYSPRRSYRERTRLSRIAAIWSTSLSPLRT